MLRLWPPLVISKSASHFKIKVIVYAFYILAVCKFDIIKLKMGKNKHKKHHRHGEDDDGTEGEGPRPSGLKLILKVGAASGGSRDKHKKKKKKKEKKKDRDRHDREGSKKDRHHKKHHRHSSDKRDKHAALEMLKGGDHIPQSHISSHGASSNPSVVSGASLIHEVAAPIIPNTGIAPLTNSNDGFSKV